jgi:hypothetical protein
MTISIGDGRRDDLLCENTEAEAELLRIEIEVRWLERIKRCVVRVYWCAPGDGCKFRSNYAL